MADFNNQLEGLAHINWEGDFDRAILELMLAITASPKDFADYLQQEFFSANEDIVSQLKGILFFIVNMYPEIFILIRMYLLEINIEKELRNLLDIYSFYLKES